MENNQLSSNFSFNELTDSSSHPELVNINREQAMQYIDSLTNLAKFILQPLRNYLEKPIHINSGFRCTALNNAIGGTTTSQHFFGEAADISVDGISTDDLFDIIKANKGIFTGHLAQVIKEEVGSRSWIHISLLTDRYASILYNRYGSTNPVFLTTTDGKNYERVS